MRDLTSKIMAPIPWISVSYTDKNLLIWLHRRLFKEICYKDEDLLLSIVSFVGGLNKSLYLAGLLGYTKAFKPYG